VRGEVGLNAALAAEMWRNLSLGLGSVQNVTQKAYELLDLLRACRLSRPNAATPRVMSISRFLNALYQPSRPTQMDGAKFSRAGDDMMLPSSLAMSPFACIRGSSTTVASSALPLLVDIQSRQVSMTN
jgi:hypothetical protein